MSEILKIHAIFKGRVQGVCFRATAKEIAQELNITGTVKNLYDGTVEIYAQGLKSQLEHFLGHLQKSFPQSFVSYNFIKTSQKFTDFSIIYGV